MFKELTTQEEKDNVSTIAILHTYKNSEIPECITIIQNYGTIGIVSGIDRYNGEHIMQLAN